MFCGAFLNPAGAQTANAVVKTSQKPFQIYVHFDGSETIAPVDETGTTNVGFEIKYVQTAC